MPRNVRTQRCGKFTVCMRIVYVVSYNGCHSPNGPLVDIFNGGVEAIDGLVLLLLDMYCTHVFLIQNDDNGEWRRNGMLWSDMVWYWFVWYNTIQYNSGANIFGGYLSVMLVVRTFTVLWYNNSVVTAKFNDIFLFFSAGSFFGRETTGSKGTCRSSTTNKYVLHSIIVAQGSRQARLHHHIIIS
eukprot:scaffold13776_cov130-Amphora_coffeaeformis.AAC.1